MGRAGGAQPSVLLDLEPKKMDVTSYWGRTRGKNPQNSQRSCTCTSDFFPNWHFSGIFSVFN
jgi:hypothetical protein